MMNFRCLIVNGLGTMRFLLLLLLSAGCFAADFERINPEAERLYAEKSFAKAHELYAAMDVSKLSASEKRWVEFRQADTLWRGAEGEGDEDVGKTARDTGEKALQALVQGRDRADEQDRVWAEAQESIGQLQLQY